MATPFDDAQVRWLFDAIKTNPPIDGADGPQGPQGPTGPQGVRGEKGVDGADGPQGPQGATGPAGLQGRPGVDGVDGEDGVTGPQGPRGERGFQGPKGSKGADGDTGAAGRNGAPGGAGMMGVQGPQGPAGGGGSGPFEDLEVSNNLTVGNIVHASNLANDGNIQVVATATGNVFVGGAAGVVIEADAGSGIALVGDELTFNGNPILGTVVVDNPPTNPVVGYYTITVTGGPTGGTFTLHLEIRDPDDETNPSATVDTDTAAIPFDADPTAIAAAILAAVVAAGWPGASIGPQVAQIYFDFPAFIDITLADNSLTGGTAPDVVIGEDATGSNGTRGYPLATTLLSTAATSLFTNFGGAGPDVNGDGDYPLWYASSIGPNGVTFPASMDGRVVRIGPNGFEIFDADDMMTPLSYFGSFNGHVSGSDFDTNFDGHTSFETQTIEGVPDDDYVALLNAPGLHRSELAAVETQVGTVDVAAFNTMRDALIKLGAILDGD